MNPILGIFRSRRVLLMFVLGFSSGLPFNLIGTTLTAWMVTAGVKLSTVGMMSLVSLPYSLKFVWAPLLDRYRLPLLGRRRGWMIVSQVGLMAALIALGVVGRRVLMGAASTALVVSYGALGKPAPLLPAVVTVALFALLAAFLAASQDIVIDAYRTDLLERDERAAGTSTFVFGYRIAMLTAGGLALILSDHLSWTLVYALMAALLVVGMVGAWRAPEPVVDRPPRRLRDAVIDPFVDYFRRPRALPLLLLVMLYSLGDVLARSMVTPFLLHHGFSRTEIGGVNKGFGVGATILGTLGAGGLVARFGLWRCLLAFSALYPMGAGCYALLAGVGKSHAMLFLAVGVDCVCTGLAVAALDAFLMALCNRRFSATQYALLTAASGIVGRLVSAGSGFLADRFGFAHFFLGTMVVALPVLALLVLLRREIVIADLGEAPGAPPPTALDGNASIALGDKSTPAPSTYRGGTT